MPDVLQWKHQVNVAISKYARYKPADEQEDLRQECYLSLMQAEAELARANTPSSYAFTVCKHRILDLVKKPRNEEEPEIPEGFDSLADARMTADKILQGLTQDEEFLLRNLYGIGCRRLNMAEVGRAMQQSEATVSRKHKKLLTKLKEMFCQLK